MKIGIVGSEAAKFTPATEWDARALIRSLLQPGDVVISGACHLGGIDVWCMEEAEAMGLRTVEHWPRVRSWSNGYRPRNMRIAQDADYVACITVKTLPATYTGLRFPLCYHCGTDTHIKSGGCWTVRYALTLGKPGRIYVIG